MEEKPYIPTFKCLLLGDSKVGKTTYVRRHLTGDFTRHFTPVIGAEIHYIPFHTNRGVIKFEVWDVLDQDKTGRIRDSIYKFTQCAIIMFDVQSHVSYKNVFNWHERILKNCGDIPVSICGNKVDAKVRSVRPHDITTIYEKNINYNEVSAKCNYNFEKPFLWMAATLMNDKNLSLMVLPKLAAPDVKFDAPFQRNLEKEIRVMRQASQSANTDTIKDIILARPIKVGKLELTRNQQHTLERINSLEGKRRCSTAVDKYSSSGKSSSMEETRFKENKGPFLYPKESLQEWLRSCSFPNADVDSSRQKRMELKSKSFSQYWNVKISSISKKKVSGKNPYRNPHKIVQAKTVC